MTTLASLSQFSRSRRAWLYVALSALLLELTALYFQYGMNLSPCVMCIYIRLAVLGILLAGIIGSIRPKYLLGRLMGVLVWAASSLWGLTLSKELVNIQTNPSPFATCDFLPNFPSWMPLHEWIPSFFMPTGMCTDLPWQWLNLSMGQWMIGVFSIYLLVIAVFLVPILLSDKKAH